MFSLNKDGKSCQISWRSQRVRHVARSTLAAECLAFADGSDAAAFVTKLALEFQLVNQNSSVVAITDSKSLYDAANTSTMYSDRRLRVEMAAIREAKESEELEIKWTNSSNQLADVLTKKGASPIPLCKTVSEGAIVHRC